MPTRRSLANEMLTASQKAHYRWHARSVDDEVIEAFKGYQLSQRLSATTIRNRESLIRGFARSMDAPLCEATPHDLRKHLGRTTVAASTTRTERGALRAFYTFLVEDGYLEKNPADRLPAVKVPKGEPRPFTREQIEAMLNGGAYRRTRAMILIGYYQGFRVSQIARVRGDDIDLMTNTVRTVSKGGKERRVPLHATIRLLAEQMPQGWWFPARNGADRPIHGSSVTDLITKAKLRAGITDPRLTPHSLRHSMGTHLVDQGVDIRIIQELMLHEDLSTTQIYAGVSERLKAEGIQKLEPMIIPAKAVRLAA